MTLLNPSPIINSLQFSQPFSYREKTNTLNQDTGYFESTYSDPIDATGSIQPVEREELHEVMATVMAGQAVKEAIIIYTQAPLGVGELGDPSNGGSIVSYRNLEWLCVDVENYLPHGHVEAIAVRIDGQNN
jgi:hypothetical protein